MAKQNLSAHQQKIVKRYYEHRDTIMLTRLSEIVTDLYLCDTRKKSDRLWKSAENALQKCGVEPHRIKHILDKRDAKVLAELVTEMQK